MDWNDVAQTARAVRSEMGISQEELALRAGVSRPTIARLEAGQQIQPSSLQAVLQQLDLRLAVTRGAHR